MISSKEILIKTGISRATLNNYINLGILSKPLVRQPAAGETVAPVLGYFPDWALERIEQVLRMKAEGLTMAQIIARVGGRPEQAAEAQPGAADTAVSSVRQGIHLSLDDVVHPAYMVNYSFELTWYNEAARRTVLGFDAPPPGSESRNIFLMLADQPRGQSASPRDRLLRLHITLAKARLSKPAMLGIVKSMDRHVAALVDEVYEQTDGISGKTVVELPYTPEEGDSAPQWLVYGIYFREGILIVHIPAGEADPTLLEFLARRDVVIRNLMRKRLPVLTPLAVLVADLQHSVKICSELPPEEYFELINEMWSTLAPVFRRYYGTHGKHVGDGIVYYFFPQPDHSYIFNAIACAHEIKLEMRKLSKQWQLRKNWLNELYLNVGLHEGQEWLGTFQSASSVEFAVLGDTINHAARLSDFARFGAIWATKNLVSKLTPEERARVEFGVTRRGGDGREHFVTSSYSQLGALIDLTAERHEKLRDIATLPITEIRALRLAADAAPAQ